MALTALAADHLRSAIKNLDAATEIQNLLEGEAALEIQDNVVLGLGDDSDQALINRSSSLSANTAVTSVLVGTPAVAAIPANSLIVSNVTADGDQVFVTRPAAGANSIEWLRNDASAGETVFNEASGDIDFRIESNALSSFFVIDANACLNGQLSIGAAIPTNPQAMFALQPPANATGVTANQNYYHASLLPGGATVIPTGTAAIAASLNVAEPNLTATGTITVAATVRIADAPTEGSSNYALWVDSGVSRFDGNLEFNATAASLVGARTTAGTTAVAITGTTALALNDSGGIFTVSQGAAYDIDLPSPTTGPGLSYFFSLTAPAANNVTVTVAGGAATFVGSVITEGQIVVATGATLTFASGVAVLGDSIEIRSIATNLYHVRAVSSILNGITIA